MISLLILGVVICASARIVRDVESLSVPIAPDHVHLGGLFAPIAENGELDIQQIENIAAFVMAINHINNKTDGIYDNILPQTELKFHVQYETSMVSAASNFINLATAFDGDGPFGVVNALPNEGALIVNQLATKLKIPNILSYASSGLFNDYAQFPYLTKVAALDSHQGTVIQNLICLFAKKIVVFVGTGYDDIATFDEFTDESICDLTIMAHISVRDKIVTFRNEIATAKETGARFFIMFLPPNQAAPLIEQGRAAGLFDKYTVICIPDRGINNIAEHFSSPNVNLAYLLTGVFTFRYWPNYYLSTNQSAVARAFARQWREQPSTLGTTVNGKQICANTTDYDGDQYLYKLPLEGEGGDEEWVCIGLNFGSYDESGAMMQPFTGLTYDATIMMALAAHTAISSGRDYHDADVLQQILVEEITLDGVSGPIDLFEGFPEYGNEGRGSRTTFLEYDIYNFNPIVYSSYQAAIGESSSILPVSSSSAEPIDPRLDIQQLLKDYVDQNINRDGKKLVISRNSNNKNLHRLAEEELDYEAFVLNPFIVFIGNYDAVNRQYVACEPMDFMTCFPPMFGTETQGSYFYPPADSPPPIVEDMGSFTHGVLFPLLGAITVFLVVIFGIFTGINMKSKIIKASQPILLWCILSGGLLAAARIIIGGINKTEQVCTAEFWIGHLAFVVLIGSLFVKSYRVHCIVNTKKLIKVTFTSKQAFLLLATIVFLTIVYLLIANFVGKPKLQLLSSVKANQEYISSYCTLDYPQFQTALFALEALLLTFAFHVCWEIRNVPDIVNESKQISTAMSAIVLVSVLIMPIVYLLGLPHYTCEIIASLAFAFGAITTLLLLFIPKVYLIYFPVTKSNSIVPAGANTAGGAARGGGNGPQHRSPSNNYINNNNNNNYSHITGTTAVTFQSVDEFLKGKAKEERLQLCYQQMQGWQAIVVHEQQAALQTRDTNSHSHESGPDEAANNHDDSNNNINMNAKMNNYLAPADNNINNNNAMFGINNADIEEGGGDNDDALEGAEDGRSFFAEDSSKPAADIIAPVLKKMGSILAPIRSMSDLHTNLHHDSSSTNAAVATNESITSTNAIDNSNNTNIHRNSNSHINFESDIHVPKTSPLKSVPVSSNNSKIASDIQIQEISTSISIAQLN